MADTLLGNLVWRITGDTKDFDSKVGASEKTLTGFSAKSAIGIAAIGVGVGVALAKIGAFVKESLKVSIAAQEQISKYGVVFGELGNDSEKAAKQFADAFDLAGASAKEMLAQTGNLLQGMGATTDESLRMSVQVNTLASDLASFTNNQGGAQAASDALTKALLGERESMKTLGIAILESDVLLRVAENGKKDFTGTALKMAKAEATLQLITEQSANAIGDYSRTQDSAANSQKRAAEATKALQIALGTQLSPALKVVSNIWAAIAVAVTKVIEENKNLVDASRATTAGNATLQQRIDLLEAEKVKLQDVLKQYNVTEEQAKNSYNDLVRATALEIMNTTKRIDAIKKQQQIENGVNDAKRIEAERQAALEALRIENLSKLNELLESEKTEYEELADKIKILEGIKTTAGIDEINRLKLIAEYRQRQADITEEQQIKEAENSEEAFVTEAENIEKSKELWDGWADNAEERMEKLYTVGMDSLMTGFSDIGSAIAQNSLDWKVFAKSGLNALAAIIEAMGHELLAQAAKSIAFSWSTFGASLVGAAPALSGAAAAYTASGLIKGYAGAFEQGGIVPGTSYTGDKMVASVNSGEEILRRDDPRNSLNGGGSSTIVIQLDGRTIAQSTVNLVNNGEYLIKGGSII